MKNWVSVAVMSVLLAFSTAALVVVMETVPVGNAGNAADRGVGEAKGAGAIALCPFSLYSLFLRGESPAGLFFAAACG